MEEPEWQPSTFADRKYDVPVKNDHGEMSFGARHWVASDGGRRPCLLHQPHGHTCIPAIRAQSINLRVRVNAPLHRLFYKQGRQKGIGLPGYAAGHALKIMKKPSRT